MRRFFLMLAWWPFLLAILFPFALDGLARRKIKQSNFDYSSPSAHRYSFFVLFGILYVLLLGLTFPLSSAAAGHAGCLCGFCCGGERLFGAYAEEGLMGEALMLWIVLASRRTYALTSI